MPLRRKRINADLHVSLTKEDRLKIERLAVENDLTIAAEARYLIKKALKLEASEAVAAT